jgi:DNA modification methylase
LGLEPSIELYVEHITEIFREVRRVLRKDGTLWLNISDSYVAGPTGHQDISNANGKAAAMFAKGGRYRVDNLRKDAAKGRSNGGLKPKDLMMVPARVALALQADGYYLRSEITWCKRAPMPESVKDRPTNATEKIYLFAKSEKYFYDQEAVREAGEGYGRGTGPGAFRSARYTNNASFDNSAEIGSNGTHAHSFEGGRNLWNYWLVSPSAFPESHFATFPPELPEKCIKAGTSERGCCPECGAPWRRVVEPVGVSLHGSSRSRADVPTQEVSQSSVFRTGVITHNGTTGWQPSCKHTHDPIPCTVLDPFTGAGTSGLVALRLGRAFVGLELKPEYVEMATRRILNDAPLLNSVGLEVSA